MPVKSSSPITGDEKEIWSHQNNTIAKAQKNSKKFSGIEIDVVFDKNTNSLNVRHDIEAAPSDIELVDIINVTDSSACKYWIDLKNLSPQNLENVLDQFASISQKHQTFKKRAIIESHNPKALSTLAKKGYYTSYWVPHYNDSWLSYIKFLLRTKPYLLTNRFSALSANTSMLPFLDLFYPNLNYHIWTHDFENDSLIEETRKIFTHPKIKVLLVDYSDPTILLNKND